MLSLEDIDLLLRRGDICSAYDACRDALNEMNEDWRFAHRSILCLIRSGALERAFLEFSALNEDLKNAHEDMLVLNGRLLKAVALESAPPHRARLARLASHAYGRVFQRTGGLYPGVNQASLLALAGDYDQAKGLAGHLLAHGFEEPDYNPERYYYWASLAECYGLLGDEPAFCRALHRSIDVDPTHYGARAVTLNQLEWALQEHPLLLRHLDACRGPACLHFAGSIFPDLGVGALDEHARAKIYDDVRAWVRQYNIGFAYGALAAGADMLIVEALLAEGCEVSLVLPAPTGVFYDYSVAPYGEYWVKRFEALIRQVESIRWMHEGREGLSAAGIAYANEVAMGLTHLRAQALGVKARQLILSRDRSDEQSFSYLCHARWTQTAMASQVWPLKIDPASTPALPPAPLPRPHSALRAMIFGDVRGYSQLSDDQIPLFVEGIWQALVMCYRDLTHPPRFENSWGDGLFLVFEDVEDAAQAAMALQACFRDLDLAQLGLPEHLALRLGVHYGPVHELEDPVLGRKNVFGAQVVTAARIEPLTPPGAIYVSEAFAATLTLLGQGQYRCAYIGRNILQGHGDMGLYTLRPAFNSVSRLN